MTPVSASRTTPGLLGPWAGGLGRTLTEREGCPVPRAMFTSHQELVGKLIASQTPAVLTLFTIRGGTCTHPSPALVTEPAPLPEGPE